MRTLLIAVLAVATWYDPQVLIDKGGLPACYDARYLLPSGVGTHVDGFVAVDAGMLKHGVVECGEVLTVYYPDYGITRKYVVWDIGPLQSYGHYIEDYHDLPYMLDIAQFPSPGEEASRGWPVALDGLLSARVRIYSYSKLLVEAERRIPR